MISEQPETESEQLLNVRETARRLGVHENTVRNWVRKGRISPAPGGSRSLRFDAAEVERLVRGGGEEASSVEPERRTIGPELVNGSQLDQWAATRSAQDHFPQLMRRLLAATPGIGNLTVRSGEGVAAPGWDGEASSVGTAYLPRGFLGFEFSVEARSKKKAQEDYDKRKLGKGAKDEIFVFATPRRWASATAWARDRRAEGHFADVKVLDADALEGWLQQTPAVHHWISEELGRKPKDATSLENWWLRFGARTEPPLPPDLFLAGRDAARHRLAEFLLGPPGAIVVQAAWREDAVAFVYATIERMEEGDDPQPPLVVHSAEVWDRVIPHPGRMTLLPLFDGADLAAAQQVGHHVVVPLGSEQVVLGERLELVRPGRSGAMKALEEAGIDSGAAYELAALARRSMPSLLRKLARSPAFARPDWAQPPDGQVLAPLVLVGAWTIGKDDLKIVSELAARPWPEIERALLHWRETEDPPFVRPSDEWYLASADESFLLFCNQLTGSDLKRWHEIVKRVLLEADPKLKLAPQDRPMASLRRTVRTYSSVLRGGLAQGIALAGSAGEVVLADGKTAASHARELVRALLAAANADRSGRTWWALSEELRALAEASPETFLDAVHEDLDEAEPILAMMFQDDDRSSALFSSSSHTGLLWALEALCWSPEYLTDATRALARLAAIDPGGRLANRPAASLASVLVGWIHHTSASRDEKIKALEQICAQHPVVGWKLILDLWPNSHATASPPAAPRFRDWKPEDRGVSFAEWSDYISRLVDIAVQLAGSDPERWAELSTRTGPLPPSERKRFLVALEGFADPDRLDSEGQLRLWEAIDREVARHRQFPDAGWSLEEETLQPLEAIAERIEPRSDVGRFSYLFGWHPDLRGVETGEPEYREELQRLRCEALAATVEADGLEALRALAGRVEAPGQLGWALGEIGAEELTAGLIPWLGAEDPALKEVATTWASCRLAASGTPLLRDLLSRPDTRDPKLRVQLALAAPASAETWDLLAEDPELSDSYWAATRPWGIQPADAERAARELLAHDLPWASVDVLNIALRPKGEQGIGADLIEATLDGAMTANPATGHTQSPGYELGVLLDALAGDQCPPEKLARYEYAFFSLLEDYRQPQALYSLLRQDSDLFVELVSRVYRGKGQAPRKLSEDQEALAHQAWLILEHWHQLPGASDGEVDGEHLGRWVRRARLALSDADRADIGDEQVGRVLAAAPAGKDGVWPAEPVRSLLEEIGSTSVETGFFIGVRNSRGITSRGAFDGGKQERDLAANYREWSRRTRKDWPRTARVLRRLADAYETEARDHDAEAEISGDTK